MGLNIYQKTKIALNKSRKCTVAYNEYLKLSVQSTDETLNEFLQKLMEYLKKGRLVPSEREIYNTIKQEALAYIELKINEVNVFKGDLRARVRDLIDKYEEQLTQIKEMNVYDRAFENGEVEGSINTLEGIVDDLKELL